MAPDALHALAVQPFAGSHQRPLLYSGLLAFIAEVRGLGLDGEWWINGSFMSEKPEPSDVDVVLFWEQASMARVQGTSHTRLTELFRQGAAKTLYGCDAYAEDARAQARRHYWRGVYGFDALDRPKGVVILSL